MIVSHFPFDIRTASYWENALFFQVVVVILLLISLVLGAVGFFYGIQGETNANIGDCKILSINK